MGAYVDRIDPATGKNRSYYKADDGKLYNDYNAAADAFAKTQAAKNPYRNPVAAGQHLLGKVFDGTDAALNNSITQPNARKIGGLVRDTVIEAAPGPQRTASDNPLGQAEGNTKKINNLRQGDVVGAGIQHQTTRTVGNARERGAEYGGRVLTRKAGQRILQTLGKNGAKVLAGTAGTGGIAGPALGAWGLWDSADTISEITTGKGLGEHMEPYVKVYQQRPNFSGLITPRF
jgi:hypothetical protein